MSLVKKDRGEKSYYYFKYERHGQVYLGTADEIKPERVLQALKYLDTRVEHYDEIRQRLIELLPDEERKKLGQIHRTRG